MKKGLKILFFFLCLFCFVTNVEAMELTKEIKTYGGSYNDYFRSVVNSPDGGYIIVGGTYSTDISGITNEGWYDAIIVKYDKDGNIEWQKNYGGSDYDYFNSIVSSPDGGYVVVGETYSTDISGITNKGRSDAIIVRYDKNGNIEWQKNYGGSNYDYFRSVVNSPDGGYIIVGETYSTDISGITNKGCYDAIIVKYDKDGNIEWQKNYGGSWNDYFNSIVSSPDGGYVVVGETHSTDISGIANKGYNDAIIVKYDKNGNIEWQKNYGGSDYDYFNSIVSSPDGGYVVVGESSSTDLAGITNKGRLDAIIVRYDKNGNVVWQKNYENSGTIDDAFYEVINDGDNFIVVGNKEDAAAPRSMYVDPDSSDSGAIIVKYNSDGNVLWTYTYGSDFDSLYSVIKQPNSTYVAVGDNGYGEDALILKVTENYEIKYDVVDNGSITGIDMTTIGAKVKLTVTPDSGYVLKEIIVTDSNGKKIEVTSSKDGYQFVMPSSDVTVKGVFAEPKYEFIEGMGQKYTLDSKNDITFKNDGLLELLTKVSINNKDLSKEYYTLESGSTIITLKSSYLNTLKVGKYTLKLEYSNGKVSETTFEVLNKLENPATGDNIVIYISLFVISVIGVLCTYIFIKRNNKKINC